MTTLQTVKWKSPLNSHFLTYPSAAHRLSRTRCTCCSGFGLLKATSNLLKTSSENDTRTKRGVSVRKPAGLLSCKPACKQAGWPKCWLYWTGVTG